MQCPTPTSLFNEDQEERIEAIIHQVLLDLVATDEEDEPVDGGYLPSPAPTGPPPSPNMFWSPPSSTSRGNSRQGRGVSFTGNSWLRSRNPSGSPALNDTFQPPATPSLRGQRRRANMYGRTTPPSPTQDSNMELSQYGETTRSTGTRYSRTPRTATSNRSRRILGQ